MITDKKTGRILRLHAIVSAVCPCGVAFQTTEDRVETGRGKHCSKQCMYRYRKSPKLKKNPRYSALHKWMAAHFGQSMECEWCGLVSSNPYKIHWANITGQYNRDRDNWARLCAKCHWHYDRRGERYA